MDKAGKQYWDESWARSEIPQAVDPHTPSLNNYVNRRFHEYFCKAFDGIDPRGMKLLEIGCARSAWLPYFAKEFGFKVCGLDYSEIGCQQERQVLAEAGVEGEVVCADLFSPPETMREAFDVVVSFGVVEHFEDTAACIEALSKFLKPKGMLITIIPNMIGLIGFIQKLINRPIFDIHVPLGINELAKAQKLPNLRLTNCLYFMSCNFCVCNLNGIQTYSWEWWVKKIILYSLEWVSALIWMLESQIGLFKSNSFTSSYIVSTAFKSEFITPANTIQESHDTNI